MTPDADAVLTQLRKGALEYCVLAALRERPLYGLELVQTLARHSSLVTSAGTLYPLLSRLRKAGRVCATTQESPNGPDRVYYRLTLQGEEALAAFALVWRPFSHDVCALLEEPA